MTDDIEVDDPETATEDLQEAPLDADRTGFDDEATAIERDPADLADAEDRVEELPDDELSPGESIADGGRGDVEPNEPA